MYFDVKNAGSSYQKMEMTWNLKLNLMKSYKANDNSTKLSCNVSVYTDNENEEK